MVLGAAILVGIVVACAFGANPMRLAEIRLRATGLVFASLALQVVIFSRPLESTSSIAHLQLALHVASYVLIDLFLILNVRLPGMGIAGLGLVCNSIAIAANHGRMPITLDAWRAVGRSAADIARTGVSNNNILAGPQTHFAWLGDIFPLPPAMPLANTISIGDALLVLGMTAFVYRNCTPRRTFSLGALVTPLRIDPFRRLLTGRLASRAGDWVTTAAIVTWIFSREHSSIAVSVFLVGRLVASTIGGLVATPVLGRFPQFRVLSFVEYGRGLFTLAMLPFAATGNVALVLALAFLSAGLGALTNSSASSVIPDLLPRNVLQMGNSMHGATRTIVMVVGSALGGFSVAAFGIATALGVDLATFVVAGALYTRLPSAAPCAPTAEAVSRREVARVIAGDRMLLGLVASFTVATAAIGLLNNSLPAFFLTRFHDANGYGYAIAAVGAGLLAGELLTALVDGQAVARRAVALGFAGAGLLLVVASAAPARSTAYLLLFLIGSCDGVTEVVYDTLLQVNVAPRLRTAAFGLASAVQNGGMLVGLAAAPLFLSLASPRAVVRDAGIGCVGAGVVAFVGMFAKRAERTASADAGHASRPSREPTNTATTPAATLPNA